MTWPTTLRGTRPQAGAQTQPVAGAGSRTGDLLVVTPWYPRPELPYSGTFVRASVRALQPHLDRVTVLHVVRCLPGEEWTPHWSDTPEGRVLRIPAPVDPMAPRDEMMRAQGAAVRAHAMDLIQSAPLIHCHVGAPTAAGLADLVPEQTRLMVTEHATYLPKVMRNPAARALYRRALARADVFSAVSDATASSLRTWFPDLAERVSVLANPLPVDTLMVRTAPASSQTQARWLYVGNLVEHKGIARLVHAFAAWCERSGEPAARLTLVGDGPQRAELEASARELGVAERVRFAGSVEPDRVAEVYADHDVLVHLSHVETFGMTCVEAAASGLAVVVTQCGGPEETLLAHQALGMARFVPIGPATQTDDVVAAVESLRGCFSPVAAQASRRYLDHHFGAGPIGARLHATLTGAPAPAPPALPGMRALAVAMDRDQARAAIAGLRAFVAQGGSGVYIAGAPIQGELPTSVRVIDVSRQIERLPFSAVERLVVCRLPGLVVRALGKLARSGLVPSRFAAPLDEWSRRSWRGLRAHRGPWTRAWRHVAPWLVARRLERQGVLEAAAELDCVIAPHLLTTPIVARALRVNPELALRSAWPRGAVLRSYATTAMRAAEPDVTPTSASPVPAAPGGRVGRQAGPRETVGLDVRDESPAQLVG